MSYEVYGEETIKQEYRTLLDSNDPFDRLVLELVEEGKLKVGFVPLKGNRWQFIKKFIPRILTH